MMTTLLEAERCRRGTPELAAKAGGFTIVAPPAPSVVSGVTLHEGDVVVAVGGVPADELAADVLTDLLRGRSGAWVAIEAGVAEDGALRVRLEPVD
jgi:hypothetical protein